MPAKPVRKEPIIMNERRLIGEMFQFYEWRDRQGLEAFVLKLAKGDIQLESVQKTRKGNGPSEISGADNPETGTDPG